MNSLKQTEIYLQFILRRVFWKSHIQSYVMFCSCEFDQANWSASILVIQFAASFSEIHLVKEIQLCSCEFVKANWDEFVVQFALSFSESLLVKEIQLYSYEFDEANWIGEKESLHFPWMI